MRSGLPNRRASEHEGHKFLATYSRGGGRVLEVFLNTDMSAGSAADTNGKDAAIAISLALQHGVEFERLREGMSRKPDGTPSGALGAALDAIAEAIR